MAMTVIALAPEGLTLTLELYPVGSDTIANGAADTLTESTNDKGTYTATVAENLTGHHIARIISGGVTIGKAVVEFTGAGSTRTLDLVAGDKDGYSLALGQTTAVAQSVWQQLVVNYAATTGSFGKRIYDFLTGDAYARLGAPAGASVSADIAALLVAAEAEFPADIDGLTPRLAFETMLAVLAGEAERVDVDGTKTIAFKKRDGTTIATLEMGSPKGTRTSSVIVGEP